MTNQIQSKVVAGYLLLPLNKVEKYRGIDRQPFEPLLLESEIDPAFVPNPDDARIWVWYPAGWRREAYRLFEENSVEVNKNKGAILSSLATARQIKDLIEPHLGSYELIACQVWNLDTQFAHEADLEAPSLGYDVAYGGGDFYSALKNGLLVKPHPLLLAEYSSLLNEYGLFSNPDNIPAYIRRFKELVPSEANSEFWVYWLSYI